MLAHSAAEVPKHDLVLSALLAIIPGSRGMLGVMVICIRFEEHKHYVCRKILHSVISRGFLAEALSYFPVSYTRTAERLVFLVCAEKVALLMHACLSEHDKDDDSEVDEHGGRDDNCSKDYNNVVWGLYDEDVPSYLAF